jgi:hypothetical protein
MKKIAATLLLALPMAAFAADNEYKLVIENHKNAWKCRPARR